MNEQEALNFLFTVALELKRSFESPVILLTMKDYAESLFDSLVEMRAALVQQAEPARVADVVSDFHRHWLQNVRDVDDLKRRIRDTPRDYVSRAIDFTAECVTKRRLKFHNYVTKYLSAMSSQEFTKIQDEISTIAEMHQNVIAVLCQKRDEFNTLSDPTEFYYKITEEAEELLNWFDSLSDNLAIQYSKVVGFKLPQLSTCLKQPLQQIIDEVSASSDPEVQRIAKELESKTKHLTNSVRLSYTHDLEMRNILEKIKNLEDRINRLKLEKSSAVMALQHKAIYLEERLQSLENLKVSLYTLKSKQQQRLDCANNDTFHIFDHLLPPQERIRLVDELVSLWTHAICGNPESKSIISILSVADIKEIFSDDLGKFTVDKYGRKLYRRSDNTLYQLNEKNQFVPVNDLEKHVYFYDDCGRYYINEQEERVYKAHDNASEYLLNPEGRVMKLNEVREGVVYWYDNLGRYRFDDSGTKIYCSEDGAVLYEDDGLGNLVRMPGTNWGGDGGYSFECGAREPVETDESKYLQRTVGLALKKCIAEVVMQQPRDPIAWLAAALERYRRAERAAAAAAALRAERARADALYQAPTAPASRSGEDDSISYADPNLINYQTPYL